MALDPTKKNKNNNNKMQTLIGRAVTVRINNFANTTNPNKSLIAYIDPNNLNGYSLIGAISL